MTLGRFFPMWILWISTGMSWVSPVSGLMVCGVWHMMHSSTDRREPPCPNRGLWHWLHAWVATTERIVFTGEPLKLASGHFGLGHGSGAHAPDEYYVIESTNPKIQGFDGAAMSFVEYLYELGK